MKANEVRRELVPVCKQLRVALTREAAFELFTAGIAKWWPLERYAVTAPKAVRCALEERSGGELYEIDADGRRHPWGRILAWDPPRRLVFTWHPGRDPATAQEVEIRFQAVESGTELQLEHRGWEALGTRAAATRSDYDRGWDEVLERYARCGG